jgi:hypothetical protein
LGLLGAFTLSAPRTARANSGNSFLETIGISIAVGTVLGASTLPFYSQPGKHLSNLEYGAIAGAAVGLGVSLYEVIVKQHSDAEASYGLPGAPSLPSQADEGPTNLSGPNEIFASPGAVLPKNSRPLFWMSLVSLNW